MTMQLFLHSTGQSVEMLGHMMQLWNGRDLLGRRCEVFIVGIRTADKTLTDDLAAAYPEQMICDYDKHTGELLGVEEPPAPSGMEDAPLAEGASKRAEFGATGKVDFESWLTEKVKECRGEGAQTTPPRLPGQETDASQDSGG